MTKAEALALVAGYVGGLVDAGTIEEATGLTGPQQEHMSDANLRRLDWAKAEVARRLYKMGKEH